MFHAWVSGTTARAAAAAANDRIVRREKGGETKVKDNDCMKLEH